MSTQPGDRPFNIRQVIRAVLREEKTEDKKELLAAVRARIPDEQVGAALHQLLRVAINQAMVSNHRFKLVQRPAGAARNASVPDPLDDDETDGSPGDDRDAEARAAYFSAYIEKCLDERWTVPDGDGIPRSRRIRDMNAADCAYIAASHKRDGNRLLEIGLVFEDAGAKLAKHKVTYVGELPEPVLAEMFRKAAA